MAEITLQISDELAQRLEPLQDRLPELLAQLAPASSSPLAPVSLSQSLAPAYQEVLDFLITQPTPEEIVRFKVSQAAQTHLHHLLNQNRDRQLSANETAELDLYEHLDQLMTLLKSRAYAALQNSSLA